MSGPATYGFGGKKTVATLGFGNKTGLGTVIPIGVNDFILDAGKLTIPSFLESFVLDVGEPLVIQTSYKELDNLYTGTSSYTWAFNDDEFFVQLFQGDRTGTITKIKMILAWAYQQNMLPCRIGICVCDQGTHHPLYPIQWIGYAEIDGYDLQEYPTMTTVDVTVNCPIVAGTWYGLLVWSAEPDGEYRTKYTSSQNGVAEENAHRTTTGGVSWANFGTNADIPCYAEQEHTVNFLEEFTLDIEDYTIDFILDVIR